MKVLVIGGTGAFGARLCDLLARDGAEVTVAGRRDLDTVARVIGNLEHVDDPRSAQHPAEFPYLTMDRNGPLAGLDGFDVVVDAAGPFHAYGDDPYRIAKGAIAVGAHYFDLCDNADFCSGISALDADTKAAGVAVYSGMSSVPAISSAVVDALRGGQAPLAIDTAILPGNKAPRGRSVVESILDQSGRLFSETQAGRKMPVRSWSGPKLYDLGPLQRQGWRIEVPDQRLFPDHFDCPNVSFRAGLELGVMRYGLGAFSFLRGALGFKTRPWMVTAMMAGAKALSPFGTDTGGMVVNVDLQQDAEFTRKTWTMLARSGDGPNTPAIAIRAACRDLGALPVGAGPAVSLLPLDKVEACFDDLDIATTVSSELIQAPFRQVLGDELDTLPDVVRATHDAVTARAYKGVASVQRGDGVFARAAAVLFGFPPTTEEIEVEVVKTPHGQGETWQRRFGTSRFRSHLKPTPRGMSERFGALTFDLGLKVEDGKLHFPVKAGRIGIIPIPLFLLPKSIASEAEVDGKFQFDVLLKPPTGGVLVHYKGWLEELGNGAAGEN